MTANDETDVDRTVRALESQGVNGPNPEWVRQCLESGRWPDYMAGAMIPCPLAPLVDLHGEITRLQAKVRRLEWSHRLARDEANELRREAELWEPDRVDQSYRPASDFSPEPGR